MIGVPQRCCSRVHASARRCKLAFVAAGTSGSSPGAFSATATPHGCLGTGAVRFRPTAKGGSVFDKYVTPYCVGISLLSLVMGWLMLDEQLSDYAGGTIIMLGVYLPLLLALLVYVRGASARQAKAESRSRE